MTTPIKTCLECRHLILLDSNMVTFRPGLVFKDEQDVKEQAAAKLAGRTTTLPNPENPKLSMRVPFPPLTDEQVERWIRTGALVRRAVGERGEITELRDPLGYTPPKLGSTSGMRETDDAVESAGGKVAYPNGTGILAYHPRNLEGKGIEELNYLAQAQAPHLVPDNGFDSTEVAIAFLTANFKG